MRSEFFWLGLIVFLSATCAWGQDDKYHVPVPTHRVALVIANSDYTSIDALPSAVQEADEVADVLRGLKFDVSNARNVDFAGFKQKLDDFVATIQQDDFVVFYFSGHGFNYGTENYLVPLGFPPHVMDIEVPVNFIPVTTLQKVLRQTRPGYLLLVLDACRTAAQFDQFKKGFDDSASGVQDDADDWDEGRCKDRAARSPKAIG